MACQKHGKVPRPCSSYCQCSLQHSMVIFSKSMNLFSSVTIKGQILTGLWVGGAKLPVFTACGEVKVHATFQIFIVSIFTCKTLIQNIRKFSPYKNFLLYGSLTAFAVPKKLSADTKIVESYF